MNSSDDDSSSEIGEDEGTHAASTATSKHSIPSRAVHLPHVNAGGESGTAPRELVFQPVGKKKIDSPLADIPNPYPISSPDLNELPDYWYIVTHGTEVGIFSDRYGPQIPDDVNAL